MQNKEQKIWALLSKRYPPSEYALMKEVSDAAGYSRSRSADYIAVGLWPSRGLAINGIELKSYRSDWQSELKKPKKAENIFQYCDFFWLLTTDESVAKIEEIPITWGWLCIKGERIKVMKDAPKLTPVAVSKHFMAAMLKRACDKTNFVHIESIEDRIKEVKEKAENDKHWQYDQCKKELSEYRKMISELEESSGIRLNRWSISNKKIGEAVKFIHDNGVDSIIEKLKGLEGTASLVLSKIQSALECLPACSGDKLLNNLTEIDS